MSKQLPLVVVLGATACGKSKLAIDIARKFGGEIISADSMQVYNGLDIVTNKVTLEEQKLAKHHIIDFLNPLKRYSVVDFKRQSLDVIDNLFDKKVLPIVVGGTNYYIESLLWKDFILNKEDEILAHGSESENYDYSDRNTTLIDNEVSILEKLPKESLHNEHDLEDVDKFFKKKIYIQSFNSVSSEKLWNLLNKVDEEASHIFHPNDKRRVIRMLQIYQRTGKRYTDLLKEINKSAKEENKRSLGGPLRFYPTCVIWLDYEIEKLDRICDQRVDKMLERGLLSELEGFHEKFNKHRIDTGDMSKPDYSRGIFQSIGFKEFHEYLILDSETKKSVEGQKILKDSIEQMKLSTRKYARYQLKWIKRRFLTLGSRDLPPVFKLSTCFEDEHWSERVSNPAIRIIDSMTTGKDLDQDLLKLRQEPTENPLVNNPAKHYCETCDRTFIGTKNIDEHMRSKRHWRKVQKLGRKKAKLEESSKS